MASTFKRGKRPNVTHWISFAHLRSREQRFSYCVGPDKPTADAMCDNIERLEKLRASGDPLTGELAKWFSHLPKKLCEKLARADFVDSRKAASAMTIDQHLAAFEASLQAKGDTAKQIRLVTTRCRKLIEAARVQALSELTGEKVSRALATISDAKNLTSRTKNFYLKSFQHFCAWAVNNERMGRNPTKNLTVTLKGDIKKRRRPLTVEEVRRLVTTTADGPVRHAICGPDRALLYVFACESGCRVGDIVALRAGDFGLSDELVNVTILAAGTKNRKDRELLLSPGLSALIRRHLGNKVASAKAFSTPRFNEFAKMLRKDLLPAGITPVDGVGREVDFHALRTTSASLMISQGFDVKTAQQRLGHHDPALTLKVYAMTYREGEEAAVKRLPDLTAKPSSGSAKATGTDDGTATANRPDDSQNRAQHPAQHARNISVRQGSSSFVISDEDDGDGTSPKCQEISEVTAEMRDDSSSFVNPPGRIGAWSRITSHRIVFLR